MIKTDFPVEANIREQFSHTYNRLFEFARNNAFCDSIFNNIHKEAYKIVKYFLTLLIKKITITVRICKDFPVEANIREQFSHTYNRLFEFARNNVDAFLFTVDIQ
jgi:hypothetical protein